MINFLSCVLTVLTFTLACTTVSRSLPILMLGNGQTTNQIAAVLVAKVIGGLFALMNFKKLFSKFGIFQFLTISIVILTQVFIIIFSLFNVQIYIIIFFIFGFFEQSAGLIVKPILEDYIPKYQKQFDLFFRNFVRFLSGFLLMINHKYLGLVLISLITLTLVPYAMSEIKNLFRKNYINPYDSQILFIYNHYNDYFISAFLHHICSFMISAYFILFLNSSNFTKAAMYMSIYLWGQFVYSYPFSLFFNSFVSKKKPFILNFLIIFVCIINIIAFLKGPKLIIWDINVLQAFSISLLGGVFSLSFKTYFRDVKKNEHEISIDMTEDQIKGIASLFGVVIGLVILQFKQKAVFFIVIIMLNIVNLMHLYAKKALKKFMHS